MSVQTNQIVRLPYAATTINVSDSGKIFITPQTAGGVGVIYTLPAVASAVGAHFRFINGAPAALAGIVTITAPANTLQGVIMKGPVGGALLLSVGGSTSVNFATAASLIGDYIDLQCDGVNYYVSAMSAIALGITVA
jgi:hypothetical protein